MILNKIVQIYESSLKLSTKTKEQKFAQQNERKTDEKFSSLLEKELCKLKERDNNNERQ